MAGRRIVKGVRPVSSSVYPVEPIIPHRTIIRKIQGGNFAGSARQTCPHHRELISRRSDDRPRAR